jgi:hypothetical protein
VYRSSDYLNQFIPLHVTFSYSTSPCSGLIYNGLSVENMLAFLSLRVLHLFYFLAVLLSNIWQSFERRKPKHLAAERTKVPSHLALILVTSEDIDAETTEKSFVECIARAVTWCQAVGIRQFSVYDCEGTYQLS